MCPCLHTDKECSCVLVYIQLMFTIVLSFQGIPIIAGCSAVMQCRVHSVHTVGDHHVWYGSVFDAVVSDQAPDTLLYYVKYVQ